MNQDLSSWNQQVEYGCCGCPTSSMGAYGSQEGGLDYLARESRNLWRTLTGGSPAAPAQPARTWKGKEAYESFVKSGRVPVGPGTLVRYSRPLTRDETRWLVESICYHAYKRNRSFRVADLTPRELQALRTTPAGIAGNRQRLTWLALLMQRLCINPELPYSTERYQSADGIYPAHGPGSQSPYGYYDDEYGKLFGQGGWFQRTFRPQSYATWQAGQGADAATTALDTAVSPSSSGGADGLFPMPSETATVPAQEGRSSWWTNLFTRRRDRASTPTSRREQRQIRALVGRTVSGQDQGSRYRILQDGSVQNERLLDDGTWQRRSILPADSGLARNIRAQAVGQRRAGVMQGIAGGLSALPQILSAFGIGLPQTAPGAAPMDAGLPMEAAPEAGGRPRWLVPVLVGGGALIVVSLLVAKKRAPAPAAPAAPQRRRAR